jgi:hypothetical protein
VGGGQAFGFFRVGIRFMEKKSLDCALLEEQGAVA